MPTVIDGTTGVSQVQDGVIVEADLANGAVTSAKMATAVQPIGVGQTWQDVSASRLAATDYTNTTGRPITVNICTQVSNSSSTSEIVVAGVTVARNHTASTDSANNREQMTMTAIVPAGAVYRLTSNGANRLLWVELR